MKNRLFLYGGLGIGVIVFALVISKVHNVNKVNNQIEQNRIELNNRL